MIALSSKYNPQVAEIAVWACTKKVILCMHMTLKSHANPSNVVNTCMQLWEQMWCKGVQATLIAMLWTRVYNVVNFGCNHRGDFGTTSYRRSVLAG